MTNESRRTRSVAADLLKGVAVLLMIHVHATEQLARQSIMDGPIGGAWLASIVLIVGPSNLAALGWLRLVARWAHAFGRGRCRAKVDGEVCTMIDP